MVIMQHRHIYTTKNFSSAAIDDIIGRGSLDDWRELDSAVRSDALLIDRILKVCEAHIHDPYEQRYYFWRNHAECAYS